MLFTTVKGDEDEFWCNMTSNSCDRSTLPRSKPFEDLDSNYFHLGPHTTLSSGTGWYLLSPRHRFFTQSTHPSAAYSSQTHSSNPDGQPSS